MARQADSELDLIFHALSDPTRRAILSQLARRECNVSELAEPHNQTFAGVSKHLKVLEKAHLVDKSREGRTFRCRANLEPFGQVYDLLDSLGLFWRKQLESLEQYLNTEDFLSKEKNNGNQRERINTTKGSNKKNSSCRS